MQIEKYGEGEKILNGAQVNYGLVFEADKDEVEAVSAAYREQMDRMIENGEYSSITLAERRFARWDEEEDLTIYINAPLHIARLLEFFHGRTEQAVHVIQAENSRSAFDSSDIARRMDLGDKALQLSATIRLEFDHSDVSEDIDKKLTEEGVELFAQSDDAPKGPFE